MQPPSSLMEDIRQAFNNCDVPQIIHLLITHNNYDVSFRDESHGLQTLLMRLCHLHVDTDARRDVTRTLLHPDRRGDDVNAVDIAGRTALCHACIAERTDMIKMISQHDQCDPNKADRDGNTPLIYAVKSRRPEVVETLIDCFIHRGLDVNHYNIKGVCALSEAEHHCDSAICRLLIHKAHANTDVLDQIKLPRDVRMWKAPRSPTPEMLLASPRKKTVKRNTEVLSPLVLGSVQKPSETDTEVENANETVERDDLESSLSDVQEEEETHDEGYADGYGKLTRKGMKNSTSLPDLRSRVCLVGAGSPPSCTTNSPASSDEAVPRYERRVTQHTLDELSLPQLSEEEEEETDEPDDNNTVTPRKRNNSLSLPDLTRVPPSKNITVIKKSNGAYVTARGGHPGCTASGYDDYDDNVFEGVMSSNGLDSSNSRLKLPQLNITYQGGSVLPSLKSDSRSGFQGKPAVLRSGKQQVLPLSGRGGGNTDRSLKLMGNKVNSATSTPR